MWAYYGISSAGGRDQNEDYFRKTVYHGWEMISPA
jgi:hypothetical protein